MDNQQWVANHKPESYPRVHLPNQRLGKPDNLSHDAHNPDKLSQGAMQNTLDKRGCRTPNPWTSRAPIRRTSKEKLSLVRILQKTSESKATLQEAMQEA